MKKLPLFVLFLLVSCTSEQEPVAENQFNETIKLVETTPKELVDEFNFISLGCSLISDPYEDFAKDTFIGIKIAKEISKISYIYFGGDYYGGPRKKSQWHKDIPATFDYGKIEFGQRIDKTIYLMPPEIWNWKFTINRESLEAKSNTQIPNGNTYEISWMCELFENNILNEYTENRTLVESQEKEKQRKEKLLKQQLKEQEQLKNNKI